MSEIVLVNREELLAELRHVFDEKTSETLLSVLDKVAKQTRSTLVTHEDFNEIKQILAETVAIQKRSEERFNERFARSEERLDRIEAAIEELTQAQKKTEESLRELNQAQKKTEESLRELNQAQKRTEESLIELNQTQNRNEERFNKLETAISELAQTMDKRFEQLSKQVGGLSETVGGDIEDIGYIVLYDVLKREFGWDVGVLERTWQMWDNQPEEINIFGKATDPARPGKTIWIVGEAKHNLTSREVSRFAKQLSRARKNLIGEIFPVCFCYRARPEVQKQVLEAGIRLVFSYGKLV